MIKVGRQIGLRSYQMKIGIHNYEKYGAENRKGQ
jgi:hypothetical protein